MEIITVLQIVLAILVFIILGLIAAYFLVVYMNNRKEEEKEEEVLGIKDEELKDFNGMPRESIFKFMEFDEVKDNMIIRKNRTQYIMILQCSGVNYDLMSEEEKIAVEEGFVQFLNTLRFPIQLYIQTRSLNLREIVEDYKTRVSDIAQDIEKLNSRIQAAKETKNDRLLEKLQFEKKRKERVLDYGMDIAEYVARMSLNKNVLQQRTYLILSYYASETGATPETPKDEVDAMCFSELYTSGKDILQKRQEKLDEEINRKAIELATDSIVKADKYKQIEEMKEEQKVKERANELIDQYKDQLDEVTYNGAKEEVKKAKVRTTRKRKTKEEEAE